VLAAAVNKYMFIYLNFVHDGCTSRAPGYSKSEMVEDVAELQHTLCREALRLFGIRQRSR
jgi:galactokinase/mevalonate kinase-like predicted kinase